MRYPNSEDSASRLAAWFTQVLDAYSEGAEVNIGNFDVGNINLTLPGSSSLVPLPATFTWSVRSAIPSDSYVFNLFDLYSDAYFFTAPLGYTPNYVLNSLPAGFATYTKYYWYMAVVSPDGGSGLSYWAYGVSFSNTGFGVAGPQRPARSLGPEDPPRPRPHPGISTSPGSPAPGDVVPR